MLNSYYSENLLGLQGVKIKKVENTAKEMFIELEMERRPHKCPACGKHTDRIHDYRKQVVKDMPSLGKAVLLILRKRRYACSCGKRFFEDNTFLSRYQRMTSRKIAGIIASLGKCRSYTSVSKEQDVSVTTVLRLFNYVQYPKPKHLPTALGIDEFKGNSGGEKFHCILTDLETGKVFDILKTRYKHDLYDYFKRYPREERAKVRYFVSDMYQTYADIAKTWFPNATYIIDKYHWVRQVSFAFERVRKDVQKKFSKSHRIYFKHSRRLLLKQWKDLTDEQKQQVNVMLYASAELSTAYFLKEQLYRIIYEVPAENFEESLRSWIEDAHGSDIVPFVRCARTFRHWFSPIVHSLHHKYTNGFTEGCNNKIKVLKRISYGLHNFRRFRSRILYLFH